jgi:hypothetical protein
MGTLFRHSYRSVSGPDGQFVFPAVAPGRYVLEARSTGQPAWARAEVQVDDRAPADLPVTLQSGFFVSGHTVFEGSARRPDNASVRITLEPIRPLWNAGSAGSSATPDSLGSFRLPPVIGGRYRITAAVPAGPPGVSWFVRSVLVDGRDTAEAGFELARAADVREVTVVFTDRAAAVSGVVEDDSGEVVADATVIAFATNRELWVPQSRRIVAVRTDADGRFQLRGLPGGEYFLVATTDVDRNEWYEPAYLASIASAATRIAIGEGEQRVQFLRIRD